MFILFSLQWKHQRFKYTDENYLYISFLSIYPFALLSFGLIPFEKFLITAQKPTGKQAL